MKLLIDTHIFLWAYGAPEKLTDDALSLLENESIEKYISAASAWEIAIKWATGAIELPEYPVTLIPAKVAEAGIHNLPISMQDALRVSELPMYHHDPFDRILVAQAQRNHATILTNDKVFAKYDVEVIALWLNDDVE